MFEPRVSPITPVDRYSRVHALTLLSGRRTVRAPVYLLLSVMPESNWQNKNLLAACAPVVRPCGALAYVRACDTGFVAHMTITVSGGHGSRS
jgi:hypothetical protein